MYYITLDLEWNQAYAQKALAVQRQLSARLRGEVIQIGAVKLDKNMNICGSYQVIVKPRYFKKIHKHVSTLTGISQEMMDNGTPLTEVADSFREFCGDDFVFLTWGPDDIPMLRENFHANSLEWDWLMNSCDLQQIFNRQTDGLNKQRSLEYAMEYFGLTQELPAHDALNDAYFTAMVAASLDTVKGVATYSDIKGEYLLSDVIGDADAGDDGYVTIGELLDDKVVKSPLCPICSQPLAQREKTLHSKGQRYTILFNCKKDGDMLMVLKVHRNFNETWRAKRTIAEATDEQLEKFRQGLKQRSAVRKKTRQRKPRPPRRPAGEA